jgi:hypothetical protein
MTFYLECNTKETVSLFIISDDYFIFPFGLNAF